MHTRHVRQNNRYQNQQKPQMIETDLPGSQILELLDTTYNKAMITVFMEIKTEFKVLCKDMEILKATLHIKKNN